MASKINDLISRFSKLNNYNSDEEDDIMAEDHTDDEDMKKIDETPYFHQKVMINGDDEGEKTWFAKLSADDIDCIDFWELNRKLDRDFIKKIKHWQEDYHNKNGRYNFIDPLHICELEEETEYGYTYTYKLLDGQHRLSAYRELNNKYDRPMLPVIIHRVKNKDEMLSLFQFINNRAFLDMNQLNDERDKLVTLMNLMDKHWIINRMRKIGQGIGDKSNGIYTIFGKNRPYINKENFSQKIRDTKCFTNCSVEEILNKLIEINAIIKSLPYNRRASNIKKDSKYIQTSEYLNFYLGYDKDMKWVRELDD